MAFLFRSKTDPVTPEQALPGRDTPLRISGIHAVTGASLVPPFPAGTELAEFGMGCFWGAERLFWQTPGVVATAVGYSGGFTVNPTYEETCTGRTGHAETVLVVFDPAQVSYEELLRVFWEGHDPTTENRQGNDVGTQYRSAVYTHSDAQLAAAEASRERYEQALGDAGRLGPIATEIKPAGAFYYAEEDHQQYLHKVPNGYCGLGGTGVSCPIGVGVDAA